MIKIIASGFYSSIQNKGRVGFRSYGVPVSGALDLYSSQFANLVLGNNSNASVIEMTMTGAVLEFLKPTTICVSGADMNPQLNNNAIPLHIPITVTKNDILSFGKLKCGFRTYLAVKGGFCSEVVLGSPSMYNGITQNDKLNAGDLLKLNTDSTLNSCRKHAHVKYNNVVLKSGVLKVFKGMEFNKLSKQQQGALFNNDYKVSKLNNRMAYQILPVLKNNLVPIITSPVLPGTVQLTPSGQLIILMRDCQTTGGYPRVLQLTSDAINILSQKFTNNSLKFCLVST